MSDWTDAIKAGDSASVTALLDDDPSLLDSMENGVTPILLAMYHGKSELAHVLAARRGDQVTFGEACALGQADRAKQMLKSDPSLLNSRSADGYPAVGLAIFFRQPPVARHLIENGADVNAAADNAQRVAPVHAAAAVRDIETMRLLLDRGADPNARQQLDYTAMHGAASRGDREMASLLLEHGADGSARASDGMTPADVARKHGHSEFADWISSL